MDDQRLEGLLQFLDLNTKLFRNCLDGISDEVAQRQPNPETNSVAFLACHVIDAREYLAQLLGIPRTTQLRDSLQSYAAVVAYQHEPPLSEILDAWSSVTPQVRERLQALGPEALDAAAPESFPIDDRSLFGALVFLLHHESYHIGQVALVRKYHGVGSMRYGHRALLSRS
jgi:hypothetical protein